MRQCRHVTAPSLPLIDSSGDWVNHRVLVEAGTEVPWLQGRMKAVLGLWLISAHAVTPGARSLDLIPMAWIRRVTATILLALRVYTAAAVPAG